MTNDSMTNDSMTNDSRTPDFTLRFLSPPAEFSWRSRFLKFELKNSEWGGKVSEKGISQQRVKQHFSPGPL